MPTMAASTGAAFLPIASLAARPSRTMSTFSCTPAPTPSTASNSGPRGVSSSVSGCTSSSFAPSSLRFFCVATSVPVTRARIMSWTLPDVPGVDDADDARICGNLGRIKRKAGLFAAHEEHILADAGPHRISGHDDSSDGLARRRHRLHEQERDALERLVLVIQHQRPDDTSQLHVTFS